MELHLFIIWERGRHLEKEITDDIRKHFSILQTLDIEWSQDMVKSNFSRFYGVNLPVGINKEEQCGGGEFRMLIVEDPAPKYDLRETSHGKERVNINMFDAKSRYRQWIGGPSKVHATNNSKEFNHDLTLLLGINSQEFQSSIASTEHYAKIQQDVAGAHGWLSIEQLFHVLNNTVDYVILRGTDGLKAHAFSDSHRDCDLLVDNVFNAQSIINGTALEGPKRPHEAVVINGYTYYLDLWGWDCYYFDIQWCKHMLANRRETNGYYILDEVNNFYCLLYHCLVTKGRFSEDYMSILEAYRKTHFNDSKGYPELLVDFLKKHHYEIVTYAENGAGFHIDNPSISHYYNKYGRVISKSSCIQKDRATGELLEWKSCVYDDGDRIIKVGSDWLIRNEYSVLQKIANHDIVPRYFGIDMREGETFFSIEKIDGISLNDFFRAKGNYKRSVIKNIVRQIISILKILKSEGIIHRDFTGNNLLIDEKGKLYIIDFGWAIDTSATKFPCPEMLTSRYRPPKMYSDFYTIGAVLSELADHQLPYLNKLGTRLCEIQWSDYSDAASYATKICSVDKAATASFSLSDHFHCFLLRHRRVARYYHKAKRKLKR